MRRLALVALLSAAPVALADEPVPTWNQEVGAIFQKRCQTCHREGQAAPFSLGTRAEAAEWAEMIGEVVKDRRMPPWHAAPGVGQFLNSRRLEDAEQSAILRWIAGGLPEGEGAPPPAVEWPKGWHVGQPDAVVGPPKVFKVPATGVVGYQYFEVPTDFMQDRWVDAMEVRVTAPEVVHHVLVFAKYPDGTHQRMQGGLKGYYASGLPGDMVLPFPEGTAKPLPRGTALIFQIHYTPNGTAVEDKTELALKFAPEGATRREVRTVSLFSVDFRIPPHAAAHPVTAKHRFDKDVMLLSMLPHMHLRGKAFSYLLRLPDGTEEMLLDVPAYDFNWQNSYRLREPRFIPKGSVVIGTALFDNSKDNPANPDPARDVGFGEQTWDEMMIGYMDVVTATPEERTAWEALRSSHK